MEIEFESDFLLPSFGTDFNYYTISNLGDLETCMVFLEEQRIEYFDKCIRDQNSDSFGRSKFEPIVDWITDELLICHKLKIYLQNYQKKN